MKEPNSNSARMVSFAAAMELFAFVLMAAGDTNVLLLSIMGVCAVVLILVAVSAWKKYFERLMDYKITQASDNQPDS
jgi:hypothetical protein